MSVTVVVPFRGGCPHRERAWRWVMARYQERNPAWEIRLSLLPDGPWVKAVAVEQALPASGIVVISDADCWSDGVAWAVRQVEAGAPWAIPHHRVHRLTPSATDQVLAGAEPSRAMPTTQRPYRGTGGGGITVMPARTARAVPLDRRFVGWGGEDGSWRDALRTLVGMEHRGTSPLWHLHHPPQPRADRHTGNGDNPALAARYVEARGDRDAMAALVAAGR